MIKNSIMKDDLHDSYWLDLETSSHTVYLKDAYDDEDGVQDYTHQDVEGHFLWDDAKEDGLTVLSGTKEIDKTLWWTKYLDDCYLTKSYRISFICRDADGQHRIISSLSEVTYTRELTSTETMGYIFNHLMGIKSR